MNLLSAENLSHSFGDKGLFKDLSIGLNQGDKVALIGTNGTGKSTLLSFLAGKDQPDSGSVSVRKGIRVGYLEQSPTFDPSLTVMDVVFAEINPVAQIVKEYEKVLITGKQELLADLLVAIDEYHVSDNVSQTEDMLGRNNIAEPTA